MNHLELELDYPLGDTLPETGGVHQVAPGVLWLRMALPFALNHINLWLLEDEQDNGQGMVRGWTVIDCGIATDPTRTAWESVFATALQGRPVLRVIATHYHPDHMGLASWLCQRWGVQLWTTAGEYAVARMMSAGLPGFDSASMVEHFRRNGLAGEVTEEVRQRRNHYASLVPSVPTSYRRMIDGQSIRIGNAAWRIITGFGHSPEHAALYNEERNLLIAGDMVLPRISTNVSVQCFEPDGNPVQLYLDSLGKFSSLPGDTLVLPSHGKPFRGMHIRIRQLREHHAERLEEVLVACREAPMSGFDIVPVMFRRKLDAHQISFALGEALAHLHQLWLAGSLVRTQDEHGVFRFSARS
ncbi:MBL fold metallo-hydrolase [Lacisediminimonas sp.]|uniref:MBL fold metallo-hydrolase n=1 Tax=Lacisediminimonas sp. TaxID=3060582 RepID=UPI002727CDA8|nr:MBL fold metallo-hydrolase [Lacisediminimonas sp.]MDO8299726.1 MBL fold metallo-hydrolase [Lacisediminimonas sp.]